MFKLPLTSNSVVAAITAAVCGRSVNDNAPMSAKIPFTGGGASAPIVILAGMFERFENKLTAHKYRL